jgi:hypothetical protein
MSVSLILSEFNILAYEKTESKNKWKRDKDEYM